MWCHSVKGIHCRLHEGFRRSAIASLHAVAASAHQWNLQWVAQSGHKLNTSYQHGHGRRSGSCKGHVINCVVWRSGVS